MNLITDGLRTYATSFKIKKFFCGFEPAKMHWAFLRVTNAFQDESWDLSNSKGYEGSFISLKYISIRTFKFSIYRQTPCSLSLNDNNFVKFMRGLDKE